MSRFDEEPDADPHGECALEIGRLRAAVENMKADAARYRWLRDISEPGICAFYLSVGKAFHGVKFKPETVDLAIDDAMQSGQLKAAPTKP